MQRLGFSLVITNYLVKVLSHGKAVCMVSDISITKKVVAHYRPKSPKNDRSHGVKIIRC